MESSVVVPIPTLPLPWTTNIEVFVVLPTCMIKELALVGILSTDKVAIGVEVPIPTLPLNHATPFVGTVVDPTESVVIVVVAKVDVPESVKLCAPRFTFVVAPVYGT